MAPRVAPTEGDDRVAGCSCSSAPPCPMGPLPPAGSGQQELGPALGNWVALQDFPAGQPCVERGVQPPAPLPAPRLVPSREGWRGADPQLPTKGRPAPAACTRGPGKATPPPATPLPPGQPRQGWAVRAAAGMHHFSKNRFGFFRLNQTSVSLPGRACCLASPAPRLALPALKAAKPCLLCIRNESAGLMDAC